ncbi:hypothetical protein [Proteiniclasticum sp.]|uniref:hypothetical protein n=1 Tax=Proteiniclasticum sp. TaxID=2053595 RepID=UPI002897B8E8|nr:hypothetical protein [Proteiniclasticum sp.]
MALPVISIITHDISYDRLKNREILSWDENISYRMKDRKLYRFLPLAAGYIIVFALFASSLYSTITPPHTGELTVKEFTNNFMHYADFYDVDLGNHKLLESGIWGTNSYDILNDHLPAHFLPPLFRFKLKDGIVQGVSFVVEVEDTDIRIVSHQDYMMLTSLSLADFGGFSIKSPERIDRFMMDIYQKSTKDFTYSNFGIALENKVETENLLNYTDYLFRDDKNKEIRYREEFSVLNTSELPSEEN